MRKNLKIYRHLFTLPSMCESIVQQITSPSAPAVCPDSH
jgi:hypothetical protein